MDLRMLSRGGAALVGAALAASVWAQSATEGEGKEPLPSPPGQVLSDVKPLPAEDRASPGAIVLPNSPVRARRTDAQLGEQDPVQATGDSVTRVLGGARAQDEAVERQGAEREEGVHEGSEEEAADAESDEPRR